MDEINELYRVWQTEKKKKTREKDRERLLEEIWNVYHPKLQVFLHSDPSCSQDEREDRASDILLRVFESLDNYNPAYAFSTWIYRIARNSQIDQFRKKSPLFVEREPLEHEIYLNNNTQETPETLVLRDTEKGLIKEAIESLPSSDRELLFLSFYEGMKYREISKVTGVPEGTIKYNIHRIKKELKNLLKEDLTL